MWFRRVPPGQADLKLVVGLGNIGRQYVNTRHNIGFAVVDEVARRCNARFRAGKFKGEEATIRLGEQRVVLLKPHTLMNLSGDAVVAATRFFKLPLSHLLVVCDDVNLPLGKIRIRPGGSDGGHNGLWSIIHRVGGQDFARLRVGIGEPPAGWEMVDYVLSAFTSAERGVLAEVITASAQAVEDWATGPIDVAMNRWNGWSAG